MICLGIEGTAEKLGIGIVSDEGEIFSNVTKHQPLVTGIHPREAAEHHAGNIRSVLDAALKNANLDLKDIDLVAFSQGPGLGPCLRVAAVSARTLSLTNNIPIIGVNHCIGHIEIGMLSTDAIDPLTLYVSGGNTQIIAFSFGRYRVFGETLDIAIGNCLDQFARAVGIGSPGGPIVEKLAKKGRYIPLPYVVKGMDLSFSGLYSASVTLAKKHKIEDVCRGLEETSFAMITEVTERALAHTEKKEVMLAGGVAINRRLQEMISKMAEEHGASFFIPPCDMLGDNGAMIAWVGILRYGAGERQAIRDTGVKQRFRTDEVDVKWR
ncbi:MAG: bifunctional N(6)-L-threonylcarbamoyladenine synthase/serine/threonine protein kinase [Candidatus Hydrothermarchaeaceae archaeon]